MYVINSLSNELLFVVNRLWIVLQVFLVHVISRLQNCSSPAEVARSLYKSRYEPLYPVNSAFIITERKQFQCFQDQQFELSDKIQKLVIS